MGNKKSISHKTNIKKLTLLAMFTTIALTIFVVESAIPTFIPVPGVKLGLANIVTLFVIKRMSVKDAASVLFMRVVLATIFAGQAVSLIYSMSGGVMCLMVMALINKLLSGKYIFITSIFGAVAHNTGQLLAALFVLGMSGILAYMPFLMISGVVTGLFTGLICYFADRYVPLSFTQQ
ncbi:MAG: Gx transporter family protein [Lachnospira sp.]